MQNKSKRKPSKKLEKDLARTRNTETDCSPGAVLWLKRSDKKVSFDDPQKGGHFSCGKPLPHAGAPIVLHGHIPDFTSSSEGGIWSCRGLDPVFQEVLWPRWSSEPQIAGSSPARIIELLLEEVIALCSRAAEACSKQGSGIAQTYSACLFAWIMTGAPTRLHQLDDRWAL